MEARSGFDDDGTMEDAMAEQDELESRVSVACLSALKALFALFKFWHFKSDYELEDVQVMSALALQESRERRETKLQVEIESGAASLWVFILLYEYIAGQLVRCLDRQVSRN